MASLDGLSAPFSRTAPVMVNLKTVFLMCKHVMPVMEAKGAGREKCCAAWRGS